MPKLNIKLHQALITIGIVLVSIACFIIIGVGGGLCITGLMLILIGLIAYCVE